MTTIKLLSFSSASLYALSRGLVFRIAMEESGILGAFVISPELSPQKSLDYGGLLWT